MTDVEILDTLRRINQRIVRVDSSGELEQAVCDVVAGSTPYVFAWIGGHDEETGEIVPRTSAGVAEGYLESISITVEGPRGNGPTGRAVRTGEVQAVQDVSADADYDPWRDEASERGYRSSIAIPLVYEGSLYGVLNVYADRPNAFDERERTLLAEVGETIGYALHTYDVRERQRQQYRNLFEQAPVMYVLTREEDGVAVVDDCNQRFLDTLGYPESAVVGRPLADFYTDESAARLEAYGYDRALEDEFIREERGLVAADGETVETRMRAVPRIGSDGDVVGTLVLFTDVTKQKQAEAVLRHAEALDASIDGVAIFNPDGNCVYANDAFVSMYGDDAPRSVEGRPYDAFVADAERFADEALSSVESGGTWRGETTARRLTGETFPAEISLTSVEDVGVVCIVRDVTERTERERELREERRRYRALTETAPDAILVADPDSGDIVEANTRATELTGYPKDELVGMSQARLHPDEEAYRDFFESHVEAMRDDGRMLQTELEDGSDILVERKDGETRAVEINASLLRTGDERLVLGIFRDVTERKRQERRLREIQRQYETVFENTQDALFLVDVDDAGTFRYARFNSAEEEVTGLTTDEVRGKTPREAFGDAVGSEMASRYRRCLDARAPVTYEEELTLAGETQTWQTKLTPVVVDGEVTQLVGAARDITALREYERRLEAQRDQLELLNRIVRHDIRNDMTVVLGYAELLREELPDELRDDADRILETSRHTVELTKTARDLVDLTRSSERPDLRAVDLTDALVDEFENVRRSYPAATFERETVPDVDVRANDLLPAVFRNLLHNAVQHNDKDDPRVAVQVDEDDEAVFVRVADNGPGVPDDRKEDIFGKGERALDSPGTGMGLYLVTTLLEKYGGDVRVEDNDPEGSVFVVELPRADA
ncbi:MAG: PAS domain S-box protein [Haloferacaceae archaeon]